MVKRTVVVALRVLALTVVLVVCFVFAALLSGLARPQPLVQSTPAASAPEDAGAVAIPGERPPAEVRQEMQRAQAEQAAAFFKPMSAFGLLVSAAFAWMLLRSGWTGWPLAAATFLACFGLGTVVSQIESAIYLPAKMPPGMLRSIVLTGL